MKDKYVTIGPKDFIDGPYIKCPKCGKNTFGILMICANHYVRRCNECFYPPPDDLSCLFDLPKLNKRIIYIDQFAISNMMKFLNPETKAYQKGQVLPFWGELFERLDSLCKLQLLICPDSEFQREESLLAPYFIKLKRMYELLSHGISFFDYSTIKRFQVHRDFEVWVSKGKKSHPEINVNMITHGNLNAWQDKLIISVNISSSQDIIDSIRSAREKSTEQLSSAFKIWQTQKEETFKIWYEEEMGTLAKVVIDIYTNYLKKYSLISYGCMPLVLDEILPPPWVITINCMHDILKENGISENKERWKMIGDYLRSDSFKNILFVKIGCMLWAAVRRRVALGGQREPPNAGLVTDIEMISTLLPYCDAMFVDNECRSLLMEKPLCDEIDYGTRVFSLSCKEEFLKYLDSIRESASREHLNRIKEVYGNDWDKAYTTIYRDK